MKKFFISTAIFSFCFIMIFSCGTVLAEEAVDNYDLLMPSPNNYLYLVSPEIAAVDDDLIAVYDRADNSVNLAGRVSKKIFLNLDNQDEYVTQIVLKNNDLFILTCYSALYYYDISNFTLTREYLSTTIAGIYIDNGNLYIYDGLISITTFNLENMSSTTKNDNKYRLMNTKSIAVKGNTVYALKWDGSIIKFDLATSSSAVFYSGKQFNQICLLNNGCLYALDNTNLYAFNFDGEILKTDSIISAFSTVNNLKHISSDGNSIAVLDSIERAVICFDKNYNINNIYGCSGNLDGWFDSPAEIISTDKDILYIWDKGNHRITKHLYDNTVIPNTKSLPYSNTFNPSCFTVYGETVFLASGNKIYYSAEDLINPSVLTTDFDISSIAVNDKTIYVFDKNTNAVYFCNTLNSVKEFKLFSHIPSDTVKIKAVDGNNAILYVMADNGIYLYGKHGANQAQIVFSDFNISNATDFNIDYIGNIYISSKKDQTKFITKFTRNLSSFTKSEEIEIKNTVYAIDNISSFTFSNKDIKNNVFAICSNKNMLIKINNNADLKIVNETLFTVNEPIDTKTVLDSDQIAFALSDNTYLYKYDNNFNNSIENIYNNSKLIVFKQYSNEELVYVMTESNQFGYINKNDIKQYTPELYGNTITARALHDTVNVYVFPNATASQFTTLNKDAILTVIDNAGDFNNYLWWNKVTYKVDGEIHSGYVLRTRIIEYLNIQNTEKPKYAKAKSSRIGAKVNVYALEDAKSAVLTTLTDGTKIKLLEEFNSENEYTLIEYGDFVGYVSTSDLTIEKGLTNGQIIAIILACLILCTTAVYIFISRRNK